MMPAVRDWRAWIALAGAILLAGACGSADDEGPTNPRLRRGARECPLASGVARDVSGDFNGAAGAPVRRVVLMGGSAEVEPAARVFAESAGGGDLLVLRASGSTTSYNDWFREQLGADPEPSSASTVRVDDAALASSPSVMCMVANAEAVWLAGGDQWDYVGHWEGALLEALSSLHERQTSIGGTSAGAVVLGEAAFDARRGSVTSAEALAKPLDADVSVSLSPLAQPELVGWIVDSHFAEREREGRMLAFLARMLPLTGRDTVYGAGLDEQAALVIDGDAYAVMAAGGRSVWLYRLIGPVELAEGEPLELSALRVGLQNGATGAWPYVFDGTADTVRVVAGVIENGI